MNREIENLMKNWGEISPYFQNSFSHNMYLRKKKICKPKLKACLGRKKAVCRINSHCYSRIF